MHQLIRLAAALAVIGWSAMNPAAAGKALAEDFPALAAQCAPTVHPQTLAAVVHQESGFNPLAIGVNGSPQVRVRANTVDEAVGIAERLIGQGRSIDLGLGQINSSNLRWLGLSVREAFQPCRNLAAAGRVLTNNYLRYREDATNDQAALDAALSAYNTGNRTRGLRNGYVAKVRRKAGVGVLTAPGEPTQSTETDQPAPSAQGAPAVQTWDVFARQALTAASRRSGGAVLIYRGDQ